MTRLKLPKVGLRTIKTLISIAIILFVYHLLDRNPCFACIGALFGMGNDYASGRKAGFTRALGTLIGGLLVIPFYYLSINHPLGLPEEIWMLIGIFFVIYINQIIGSTVAIQPASVVYFVVFCTVNQDNYLIYILNRIVDTFLGVCLSLLINTIHKPPKDRKKAE